MNTRLYNVTRAAPLSYLHMKNNTLVINGATIAEAVRNTYQPFGVLEYCILAISLIDEDTSIAVRRTNLLAIRNCLIIHQNTIFLIQQHQLEANRPGVFDTMYLSELNEPEVKQEIIKATRSLIAAEY